MIFFEDQFIIEVIIAMVLMIILFLGLILYVRFSYVIDRRWKKSMLDILQTLLAKYVNCKDEKEILKLKKRIVKLSSSKGKKELLLSLIMNLYNNFSGSYSDSAEHLYTELKLYKISLMKIRQRRWHVKIEGIVELSTMDFKDAADSIIPLLTHRNVEVRRQAKIALVKLNKLDGLKELVDHPSKMSEWTYLSILSILHHDAVRVDKSDLEYLRKSKIESILALSDHLEKHSFAYE
jgi:hypothetical protein